MSSNTRITTISKWSQLLVWALALSCLAAVCIGLIPSAAADEYDHKTIVTFSAPVEIPGKALPAGTYVFKLLDSTGNRNIVQVFNKDETQLLGTFLAIPDYRLKPSDKPVITFEERPSGSPEAIRAWFYPGDNYGQQFVYPHKRAVELAKRTNQNVLSMRDDMTKNMATTSTSASDAGIKAMQNTDVTGVNPSGDPVSLVIVVATKPEQ
jgi:hypothetical protein